MHFVSSGNMIDVNRSLLTSRCPFLVPSRTQAGTVSDTDWMDFVYARQFRNEAQGLIFVTHRSL